jgi:hypothetical protein
MRFARVRSFPLFGEALDLRWKGKDLGLRIIDRMNNDISLKQLLMKSDVLPIHINAYGGYRCWTIQHYPSPLPEAEQWRCYQAIARHLLAEWTTE